ELLATSNLFAKALQTPAANLMVSGVEKGGLLSCAGVSAAAQPFLAALLRARFPERTIMVVTDQLKTQESFHQDLTTWTQVVIESSQRDQGGRNQVDGAPAGEVSPAEAGAPSQRACFFPSWEMLPHEGRLPHVDVIGDRLETLIALTSPANSAAAALVVTSVTALLQRTFPRASFASQLRVLRRGAIIEPLDLIEWLEEQGYEPEAQVTQKGEIALRGGILDLFPLTSPWPVRLEFFGDELESLRFFDPITQISREEISSVTIPPAGELGLIKRFLPPEPGGTGAKTSPQQPGTLLDYLRPGTILVCCEPELLEGQAAEYERQVPSNDPLFISWEALKQKAVAEGMTLLSLSEAESVPGPPALEMHGADFQSLEAFRPLAERAPDAQVALEQRREFFAQIHRWLRQDYAVHLFCNNDGERQRFLEIWQEYGFESPEPLGTSLEEALAF